MAADEQNLVGRVLGGIKLQNKLGKGGMGSAYASPQAVIGGMREKMPDSPDQIDPKKYLAVDALAILKRLVQSKQGIFGPDEDWLKAVFPNEEISDFTTLPYEKILDVFEHKKVRDHKHPFVVKAYIPRSAEDASLKMSERFAREGRMQLRLKHRNLVEGFASGLEYGIHYLVMEYVEPTTFFHKEDTPKGPVLSKKFLDIHGLVNELQRIPPEQALHIINYSLKAVEFLKSHGIVHRDLKPDNIFLGKGDKSSPLFFDLPGPDGNPMRYYLEVKVGDLGIARMYADDATALTGANSVMGTPLFYSPEHMATTTSRADVFSLGSVLYYMLAGRVPFPDTTDVKASPMDRAWALIFKTTDAAEDYDPQLLSRYGVAAFPSRIVNLMHHKPGHSSRFAPEDPPDLPRMEATPVRALVEEALEKKKYEIVPRLSGDQIKTLEALAVKIEDLESKKDSKKGPLSEEQWMQLSDYHFEFAQTLPQPTPQNPFPHGENHRRSYHFEQAQKALEQAVHDKKLDFDYDIGAFLYDGLETFDPQTGDRKTDNLTELTDLMLNSSDILEKALTKEATQDLDDTAYRAALDDQLVRLLTYVLRGDNVSKVDEETGKEDYFLSISGDVKEKIIMVAGQRELANDPKAPRSVKEKAAYIFEVGTKAFDDLVGMLDQHNEVTYGDRRQLIKQYKVEALGTEYKLQKLLISSPSRETRTPSRGDSRDTGGMGRVRTPRAAKSPPKNGDTKDTMYVAPPVDQDVIETEAQPESADPPTPKKEPIDEFALGSTIGAPPPHQDEPAVPQSNDGAPYDPGVGKGDEQRRKSSKLAPFSESPTADVEKPKPLAKNGTNLALQSLQLVREYLKEARPHFEKILNLMKGDTINAEAIDSMRDAAENMGEYFGTANLYFSKLKKDKVGEEVYKPVAEEIDRLEMCVTLMDLLEIDVLQGQQATLTSQQDTSQEGEGYDPSLIEQQEEALRESVKEIYGPVVSAGQKDHDTTNDLAVLREYVKGEKGVEEVYETLQGLTEKGVEISETGVEVSDLVTAAESIITLEKSKPQGESTDTITSKIEDLQNKAQRIAEGVGVDLSNRAEFYTKIIESANQLGLEQLATTYKERPSPGVE